MVLSISIIYSWCNLLSVTPESKSFTWSRYWIFFMCNVFSVLFVQWTLMCLRTQHTQACVEKVRLFWFKLLLLNYRINFLFCFYCAHRENFKRKSLLQCKWKSILWRGLPGMYFRNLLLFELIWLWIVSELLSKFLTIRGQSVITFWCQNISEYRRCTFSTLLFNTNLPFSGHNFF